jgi:hypothetical protein
MIMMMKSELDSRLRGNERATMSTLNNEIGNNPDRSPIFVHASHRSGSTYFFNVLRRIERLICFDEAISDEFSYFSKNDFIRRDAQGARDRGHYFLTRYPKAEYVEVWDHVMALYPPAPAFRDYVPRGGILSSELQRYLSAFLAYASADGKRVAFCEVFSRGRAGALRQAFGGFHVAQYRDPLSQFGSSFRTLQEFGGWTFMIIPLRELGLSADNPFYSIIPEAWRVPLLPWPTNDRARRWASTEEYLSMILSSEPGALERVFRWHLLSWFLNNLAAIVHSDFVLDIDKLYDDLEYRESTRDILRAEVGVAPDFSDLTKFTRYYKFECVDIALVCDEIVAAIDTAQENGKLNAAIASLSKRKPTVPATVAIKMLRAKIDGALAEMVSTDKIIHVTSNDWKNIVQKYRHLWANPQLRCAMRYIYPFALPIVQAARMIGLMN